MDGDSHVKTGLVKLGLLACSVLLTPALAQSLPPAADAATPGAGPAPAKAANERAGAPKTLVAAASPRTAAPTAVVKIAAAGSLIVLEDGIVANAAIAQIRPPAPGFQYER